MRQELERIRRLGYAFDDDEDEIGLRCIGAPAFDDALMPTSVFPEQPPQITPERIAPLAATVLLASRSIYAQLGYNEPTVPPGKDADQ